MEWIFPIIIILLVVVLFVTQRRRRKQMVATKEKMVPGVHIMTSFGLYGRLISIDNQQNRAEIEVSEGSYIFVHPQTLAQVVTEPGEGVSEIEDSPSGEEDSRPEEEKK